MRNLLKNVLYKLSKRVIKRFEPIVIGITGSVGKTTTKEAIFSVVASKFNTRKTDKSYNQEIGIPLTILGIKPFYEDGATFWKKVKFVFEILHGVWLAYGFGDHKYPQVLVLELGADKPGDIEYLANLVKPSIGVVTAIGQIPVHVEFYPNPESLAKEKSELIKSLPPQGLTILNFDDPRVISMKHLAKGKVVTFGFSKGADIRASDVSYFINKDYETGKEEIGGLSFKVNKDDSFVPMRINHLLGSHQIYSFLAAIAVGSNFGINLIDIATSLEYVDLPKSRMYLKHGLKNSYIIDDTYNASPLAMHAALDTLYEFGNTVARISNIGKKIAILGDMKELGKYEEDAHKIVGKEVADRADILISVGEKAKVIGESAKQNGMREENIKSFNSSDEAKENVVDLVGENDIILVKGSRSMKMEKIVEALTAPVV